MNFRQSIFLVSALALAAGLAACGGSSHTTTTPPVISIAFTGTVPTSLATNAQQMLTATVSNDTGTGGVNWTVTCGSAACGSFSAANTASGTATTYTAPAAIPTGTTVTVTATSADSASATVSATITITAPAGISVALSGTLPTFILINAQQAFTAVVSNDSANAGVTWTVTCTGSCGSFTPTSTASGVPTTYTAPGSVTSVTITATSVTDPTKSASTPAIPITLTAPISVQLGTVPVSLQVSGAAAITATVNNDSANAGVTWTVTCGSGACGSFSTASTLSGVATDYTAPNAVPTGNTVTVKATSVTDTSKSASANITITTTNTTLGCSPQTPPCNFVFSVSGADANNGTYSVAGVFTVNSLGAITGGEQDFVDFGVVAHDTFNPGTSSISTTADGNLQIVLDTQDLSLGVNGVETFNGTLACSCTALLTEFDTSATGTGTLDLQNSKASPAQGYAFTASGLDSNGFALAIGGILNIDTANGDGSGGISGTNSIFDANDDGSGTTFQGETFGASTVSAPDNLGMVTFTLNPTDSTDFPQIILVGYIIDGTRIRLVESLDNFLGTTGGTAYGQGNNTGGFNTIVGNTYVVGMTGFDATGVLQAAGVFTAGGSGATGPVSGLVSYNDLSTFTATPSTLSAGGTYTVDTFGRVTMTNLTDGVATFNLQLYLKGDGQALAISMDSTDVLGGLGYGQNGTFTATSFFGNYALAAGGADLTNEEPLFAIGPVNADGIGTFTGFTDLNWLFSTPTADLPVSGTFTADVSGEFLTGTITGLDVTTPANVDNFTYYPIDTTQLVVIETDTNQLTLGLFDLEQ